jgi:signal peptidase II
MLIYGFLITILLIILDQVSKILIFNTIGLHQPVPVIDGFFRLYGVYNTGAAFSILNDHSWILLMVSIISTIIICYFMKDFSLKRRPLYSVSIVLILSGCVGNMIDRMFNNFCVYDFIELEFMNFAIFNIADCYLTVGVILMAIYLLFFDQKDPISLKMKSSKEEKIDE